MEITLGFIIGISIIGFIAWLSLGIWLYRKTSALKKGIKAEIDAALVNHKRPDKLKPLSQIAAFKVSDAVDYLFVAQEFQEKIENGSIRKIGSVQFLTGKEMFRFEAENALLFMRHRTIVIAEWGWFFLLIAPTIIPATILLIGMIAYKNYANKRANELELWLKKYLAGGFNSEANVTNSSNGNVDQIAKLHELMKSGALTPEEFESEKKKLLRIG